MDFAFVGIDGFEQQQQQQQLLEGKSKYNNNNNHGSGLVKHERSDLFEDEVSRVNKMGKRVDDLGLRSDTSKQQMLSFSSNNNNKNEVVSFEDVRLVSDKNGFSFHHHHQQNPSTYYNSRTSTGNMNGSFTGIKGPFTPAQWIELEHQAMIYKYLTANVPVPSNLLIPIRKAIQSTGYPGFSIGSYPSHSYGWGAFHLGFSGNTDPEPGRCRRTDGKKWRCSRDAVPDQKYCERHINRGRHRSRKPVEGQTGQAASGATTAKVLPPMTASMPSLVTSGGGVSTSEFGIVSSDALLNPSQKSSYSDCKTYNSLLEFNNTLQNQDEYPLRHFTGNWPPKDPSHRSAIPWPRDLKSDWTQLSMSIPESTDFSSSSSSPNQEKVTISHLGLGVGTIVAEGACQTNAWIPVAFGNTMGGPLGEVLNNSSNGMENGEGCWDGSPRLGSSPTGVLQQSTFVSVSNSSSCGSPRGEQKKTVEGPSL
ncbi:hypothetical protein KSS87_001006 [Heliosperma pusillum]|nr:hypothetical protein KSS87_001006 [Heliosperma pusillum]